MDKWLWCARVTRTRPLAADLVVGGSVRINRNRVTKPGHDVAVGDVVTVAAHGRVLVLKVLACAERRGPPAAAQGLYAALAMPGPDGSDPQKEDASGAGNC